MHECMMILYINVQNHPITAKFLYSVLCYVFLKCIRIPLIIKNHCRIYKLQFPFRPPVFLLPIISTGSPRELLLRGSHRIRACGTHAIGTAGVDASGGPMARAVFRILLTLPWRLTGDDHIQCLSERFPMRHGLPSGEIWEQISTHSCYSAQPQYILQPSVHQKEHT